MSEEGRFKIHLDQLDDYQINVRFDWKKAADVLKISLKTLYNRLNEYKPR